MIWADRMDRMVLAGGALAPVGIVIGSVAFEVAMGLAIIGWWARALLTPDLSMGRFIRDTCSNRLMLPLLCWHAAILTSLLWNGPGMKGWGHDIVMLRFLLFVAALLNIRNRKPLTAWMAYGLIFCIGFTTLNLITAHLFGHDLIGNPLIRYTGKLREAGRIANICTFAAPFFLGWALTDPRLGKRFKWILLGICFAAVALVLHMKIRTCMLSAAGGLIAVMVYAMTKCVTVWRILGGVSGIAIAIWFYFQKIGTWNLHSLYDRIYFWKISWAMWTEHPVFGVGVSAWRDGYQKIAGTGVVEAFVAPDGTVWQATTQYHAHNIVLMLLSATGILGLVTFCWLFVRMTKRVLAYPDEWRAGVISWPVVLMVNGLTGANIFGSSYFALFSFILAFIGSQKDGGIGQ